MLSEEPATFPLPALAQWRLGLEGQRFRVVEGAVRPPRDQEGFPFLSLAMCLLKAWCPFLFPERSWVLCSPWETPGSVANLLHGLRGSCPTQEQRLKLALLPKVHPHPGRAQPRPVPLFPWDREEQVRQTTRRETGRQKSPGDHEHATV